MPRPVRMVVHDLAQAQAALRAAAESGTAVILDTPPDAARAWGAPYFLSLVAAARATHPDARFDAILDCGEASGLALDALRRGVRRLRLTGPEEMVARVADIAGQSGAVVETEPAAYPLLDLAGARDPYQAALQFIGAERTR